MNKLTLQEVISVLEQHPSDKIVEHGFDLARSHPAKPEEVTFNPEAYVSVETMLKAAKKVVDKDCPGDGGWRYRMKLSTLCNLSPRIATPGEEVIGLTREMLEQALNKIAEPWPEPTEEVVKLTLGEVIDIVKTFPSDRVLHHGFAGPELYEGNPEQISFAPQQKIMVGELLAALEDSIGIVLLDGNNGYKEHEITEETLCNIGGSHHCMGDKRDGLTQEWLLDILNNRG